VYFIAAMPRVPGSKAGPEGWKEGSSPEEVRLHQTLTQSHHYFLKFYKID